MESLKAERKFMEASSTSRYDETAAYSAMNGGKLFMKVMKKIGSRCVYFAGMEEPENGEQLAEQLAGKLRNAK